MHSKALTAAFVAFAAQMVAAQTQTDCNPLEKTCPPNKALGNKKVDCDMTQGPCSAFKNLPGTVDGTTINYESAGAIFRIQTETQAPTIASPLFIFFGKLEVELQPAAGQGIVTSVVLQSKDLDEIDWEWVGGDTAQVQTNYFSKGDTSTYDRGAYHPVENVLSESHTYTVEWTPAAINWIVNGAVVRTLTYEEAGNGAKYPQTPMEVKIGTWVAGREDAPEGTVEWAGGYTNFDDAPFDAIYKRIAITDYAGTDSPATGPVSEYVWGDKSGSWESIIVKKGNGDSSDNDDEEEEQDTVTTTTEVHSTRTHQSTRTREESSTIVTETRTVETEATTMTTPTTAETTAAEETEATETGDESGEPTQVPENSASRRTIGALLAGCAGLAAAFML